MKPIKRFGNLKIPKSWQVLGIKELAPFISAYPYLKLWYWQQIKRMDIEYWKHKSKMNALYNAGFLTNDEKRYGILLKNRKPPSKEQVRLSLKIIEEQIKELELL